MLRLWSQRRDAARSSAAPRFVGKALARSAFFAVLFLVIASCSGGGCSSGCACGGVKPLPGGYPKAQIVPNAAAVRVTRPGLDFLGTNLPTLASKLLGSSGSVIHFPIPTSSSTGSLIGISYTFNICPNGPDPNATPPKCEADIDIGHAALHIDAVTPHSVKISGTIPIRLQDLPLNVTLLGDVDVGVGAGSCNGGTPQFDYKAFPVDIELPLVAETIPPRDGYTKIDTKNAIINVNITSNDVAICKNCGFATFICNFITDQIKNLAFNALIGGVTGQIKSAIEKQLCTKPIQTETPPCPTGSQPDDPDPTKATKCVYTSDPTTCVPTMLGTDGHLDLGGFLASISPGTSGGLDFMLAANGDMNPAPGTAPDANGHTPNGITLGMQGGALPQPQTDCVPAAVNPIPQNIPVPDELLRDTQTPWPQGDNGPHLGIALAGRFLNFGFTSAYNSGVLCLGVSTEQFQQLSSGYLSLIVPSIKKLTFEGKPASAAITTRPQAPPIVKVGGGTDIKKDPLLSILLPKFAIDFYVWNYDRYVRIFTFTADVTVPVNIQTGKDPVKNPNGGLLPVIGDLALANATVTNSDLLLDDPKQMAGGLQGLLGGIVGQFIGNGFKPIDLSSSLKSTGLAMTIPAGGIRKLSKGTDDFVAIFADLALASPAKVQIDTDATIVAKTVHPEAMSLETAERSKFPTLHAVFSSPQDDGRRAVEYTWWIDDGTHSAWSPDRVVVVDNDYMLLQGNHVLNVTARFADDPDSEDTTPAQAAFTIDTLAPQISVETSAKGDVGIKAWDFVTEDAALVGRYRVNPSSQRTGTWTDWAPVSGLTKLDFGSGVSVDVEVRDLEGNVGSVSQGLIRGRPDPSLRGTGGACGCSAPGSSGGVGAWAMLLAIAGIGGLMARRRAARIRGASAWLRVKAPAMTLGSLALLAASSQGCACGSNSTATTTGCGSDCNQPCGPANQAGVIGAYTSVAKAKDGTVWVAGYNDADYNNGNFWGDLVVGKFDSGKGLVAWTSVDGLPPAPTDGSCAPNDPTSWRGGFTDSGDDVGLWTSIQLGPNDNPMVSYYDASHMALKFASFDGAKWTVHEVKSAPQSDIGKYSKMIVVNGNPVIAFLTMEKGTGGHTRSKVTLAHGKVAVPAGTGDWTFEDAAVDETGPCRALICDIGQICVKETGICQAQVPGCTPACGGGGIGSAAQACVTITGKATCGTVVDDKYIDTYPNAFADYVSLANGPQGLGLVVYDRLHGNLVGVASVGGKWTATIFDGETGSRTTNPPTAVDTGDVGVGASLAIAANGDWHVSYVNGFTEALQYITVTGGKTPKTPEIVDTGKGVNGQAFGDGKHVVGDDSVIQVDGNGVVTIAYQDATIGALHVATGAPATGGTHKWTVKTVPQPSKFAGFFPQPLPGTPQFSNFWRQTDHAAAAVSGDVSFVTP